MNMKNKVLATALFAALGGMTLTAQANPWVDLTLEGVVTKSTCTMTANNGNKQVKVGVLKNTAFTAAGTLTGTPVNLDIKLDSCGAAETGDLIIDGNTNTTHPTVFVGNAADTVGFVIQDATGAAMRDRTATSDTTGIVVPAAGSKTYQFKVGMASTIHPVPNGSKPTAPVKIIYYVQ